MADTNSKVLKIQIDKKRHSSIGRTRESKAPILATEIRALKRSNSLNFISSASQNKKLNKFINPSETPRWEQLYELHDKKSRKFLEKKKIILKNQDQGRGKEIVCVCASYIYIQPYIYIKDEFNHSHPLYLSTPLPPVCGAGRWYHFINHFTPLLFPSSTAYCLLGFTLA